MLYYPVGKVRKGVVVISLKFSIPYNQDKTFACTVRCICN